MWPSDAAQPNGRQFISASLHVCAARVERHINYIKHKANKLDEDAAHWTSLKYNVFTLYFYYYIYKLIGICFVLNMRLTLEHFEPHLYILRLAMRMFNSEMVAGINGSYINHKSAEKYIYSINIISPSSKYFWVLKETIKYFIQY